MKNLQRFTAIFLSFCLFPAFANDLVEVSYDMPEAPNTRVLRYEMQHPLVSHMGNAWLEIYNDGLLKVKRPAFWKNSGEFTTTLNDAEVQSIMAHLGSEMIVGYHEQSQIASETAEASNEIFHVSDADIVTLDMRLNQTTLQNGQVVSSSEITMQLSETSPVATASQQPDNQAKQALADLDKVLRKLFDHPNLIPVNLQ